MLIANIRIFSLSEPVLVKIISNNTVLLNE